VPFEAFGCRSNFRCLFLQKAFLLKGLVAAATSVVRSRLFLQKACLLKCLVAAATSVVRSRVFLQKACLLKAPPTVTLLAGIVVFGVFIHVCSLSHCSHKVCYPTTFHRPSSSLPLNTYHLSRHLGTSSCLPPLLLSSPSTLLEHCIRLVTLETSSCLRPLLLSPPSTLPEHCKHAIS
jgi:hypothetical protein